MAKRLELYMARIQTGDGEHVLAMHAAPHPQHRHARESIGLILANRKQDVPDEPSELLELKPSSIEEIERNAKRIREANADRATPTDLYGEGNEALLLHQPSIAPGAAPTPVAPVAPAPKAAVPAAAVSKAQSPATANAAPGTEEAPAK